MRWTALFVAVTLLSSLGLSSISTEAAEDGPLLGLAHVNVQAADVEKSIAFYRDTLGFTLIDTSDIDRSGRTMHYALLKLGTCVIELSPAAQPADAGTAQPAGGPSGPLNHFALAVADVDKAVAALRAKGVSVAREPSINEQLFGGIRMVFISGPSGERIELFQFLNPDSKGARARE
jgi:catechol 2,3-dioxygenase-like lactoylglutathione lyase family enzyme